MGESVGPAPATTPAPVHEEDQRANVEALRRAVLALQERVTKLEAHARELGWLVR